MRSLAVMVSNGPLCSQGLRAAAFASKYYYRILRSYQFECGDCEKNPLSQLLGRWRICWMPSVARFQTQTVAVKGPRSWKKEQLIRGAATKP